MVVPAQFVKVLAQRQGSTRICNRLARAFLQGRIFPVTEADAELAAELLDRAGRRRILKTDALIAAMVIRAGAEFVTQKGPDFEPFTASGLRLFPVPD